MKLPLAQRFFIKVFSCLLCIDEFRKIHPALFMLLIGMPCWFITQLVLRRLTIWLNIELHFLTGLLVIGIISFITTVILVRGLLPTLCYVPQSTAMKELGLHRVSIIYEESINEIYKCIKKYDSTQKEKIKVICISGRHLFREPFFPGFNIKTPLHELAKQGKIEVIMPISDKNNITVKNRFDTYSDEYKRENGISNIDMFINEIEEGKNFLKAYLNNVFEHNTLCMWRLIITLSYCIVQNYFPNPVGCHSFFAPTFIFNKSESMAGSNSYYETFQEMFRLIKSQSHAV